MKIGLVNTNAANIFSVAKAVERIGASPVLIDTPNQLNLVKKIIVPGVGHFKAGMKKLSSANWRESFEEYTSDSSNYVLGICLGMQMLFEKSDESDETHGLALLKGQIRAMNTQTALKVPHVGWTSIEETNGQNALIHGINSNDGFYFLHSYYLPENKDSTIARSVYGEITFSSVISNGNNIFGTQFHPEKSRGAGEKLLRNFQSL